MGFLTDELGHVGDALTAGNDGLQPEIRSPPDDVVAITERCLQHTSQRGITPQSE